MLGKQGWNMRLGWGGGIVRAHENQHLLPTMGILKSIVSLHLIKKMVPAGVSFRKKLVSGTTILCS